MKLPAGVIIVIVYSRMNEGWKRERERVREGGGGRGEGGRALGAGGGAPVIRRWRHMEWRWWEGHHDCNY